MFFTTLNRVIKMGFVNFWRNSWLSLTTTMIVTLTLLVISALVILSFLGNIALDSIQDKIDVSVYFKTSVSEKEILMVKGRLENLSEVKGVEYVSREQALERFKAEHQDDALVLDSLKGDDNPLPASLEIKAENPEQYELITQALEDPFYKLLIAEDGISYYQNKTKIDRLVSITTFMRRTGLGVSLGFIVIALLVVFNSIRVTIYTRREEIEIMKLVGASNWYIRWPFVLEGVMYGIFAMLISFLVIVPLVYYLSPRVLNYLGGENLGLISSFWYSIFILGVFQFITGILIGTLSSLLAIRQHLKV
ncbi:ABC transporter permease [Patescibacteria group bacterium]|nr:MAG: ABC transporter permease [Patescibacteria group bacterium]